MSTRRYDPPQRSHPLRPRRGNSRGEGARLNGRTESPTAEWRLPKISDRFYPSWWQRRTKHRAFAQLIDEIARALRPLCQSAVSGLAEFEVVRC